MYFGFDPTVLSHRKEVWIMDPATDTYYYWLCTISVPVFYNLIFLVARFGRPRLHLADRSAVPPEVTLACLCSFQVLLQ